MTDTTVPVPDSGGPISFVRWLHAQARGDKNRQMPYSAIYRWGPAIQQILGGVDGKYSAEWVALELSQQGADAEDLSALASAEAAWRVDSVIEQAEAAGVSLDVEQPTNHENMQVEATIGKEIKAVDAKVLCGYRNHRGEGCTNDAVLGAGRCGGHGGAITDPEVRRSFLLVAFAKVIDGSRVAVDALLDVAENGRSEMARVQAAKELLDRAGVQQDQHVHIHRPEETQSEDDLVDELRRRLSTATDRLRIVAIPVSSEETETFMFTTTTDPVVPALNRGREEDIIEATVVEDDDV